MGTGNFGPHFDAIFLLSHLSLNFPELFWKFLEMCLHLQHLFMKFWSLFDAIFLWCTGSGSLGLVDPITGLIIFRMFWLDLAGDWVSPHGHIKEDEQQGPEGPISLPQEQEGAQPHRQDVLFQKFCSSFWGHISVTLFQSCSQTGSLVKIFWA